MENNMIDDILAKFDGAFAKNTIRAYRSDFIQYQTWCSHNNIDSIPATADAMAQYVDYLATVKKSATIPTLVHTNFGRDPTSEDFIDLWSETGIQPGFHSSLTLEQKVVLRVGVRRGLRCQHSIRRWG